MSKSEVYYLNSDVAKHFDQQFKEAGFYSEEYALQEYLSTKGIKGYVTLMTRETGGIKVKMCIDRDDRTSNKFNVNQLNHNINHELYDQGVNL
ncbi:hypothetical protein ETI09_03620 [Macrococcoides canis]|uniref:hypothetical protein n=1 Tax=Macrococcoides canis TaxID=1855823 RepID=UPI00105E6AB3|nr:hypothetical protein [Macrococcus canis]TDM43474.1 hypothetical protein ETI09_03620 [Macrococcus canis]